MPSAKSSAPRRMLAVGAFERDNFGDLLYRELLDRYTGDAWDITWGAPVVGPDAPAGVERWADALSDTSFDAVWTGGGEVGSTPPDYAFLTSYGERALHERRLDPARHRADLAAEMGGTILDPPYIPRPSAWPRNSGVPLVINSVGLSAIAREPESRRISLIATIRDATALSVRDSASGRLLESLGLPHSVVPDLAHSVADMHPHPGNTSEEVVVQLNAQSVDAYGIVTWADAIGAALPASPLRILLAGLAPAHDSVETATELRRLLRESRPDRQVTVSDARGVWDRVDEIASARLWVGSSLHGRIIAAAYGVPRISFAKPKVDAYAADWDSVMPYGVVPETLATAVARVLPAPGGTDRQNATAAAENMRILLGLLDPPEDADAVLRRRADGRTREIADLRRLAGSLEADLRHARTQGANLEERLAATQNAVTRRNDRIAELSENLDRITGSRRWRMFEQLDEMRARFGRG